MKNNYPPEIVKCAERLRNSTSKDVIDQYGEWKVSYIEDLATIADMWLKENPTVGNMKEL